MPTPATSLGTEPLVVTHAATCEGDCSYTY